MKSGPTYDIWRSEFENKVKEYEQGAVFIGDMYYSSDYLARCNEGYNMRKIYRDVIKEGKNGYNF